MKIVGTGLSGLIGRLLSERLEESHEVVRLKRGAFETWAEAIDGADAVINLSGENIAARRWTAKQKEEIRQSRFSSTRALVGAIGAAARKPKVLINASAVGFYGPREKTPLDETAPAGKGFLPELCVQWEKEALRAQSYGVRVVCLRTGIVLSEKGGALAKMLPPFRFFLGGPLGSGDQFMSWIHIEDEVEAIRHCLTHEEVAGPVNAVAPGALSMKDFAKTLGTVLKRPSWLPAPVFALRLLLGEMADMLTTGQNVVPRKLLKAHYSFRFPTLEPALRNILSTD